MLMARQPMQDATKRCEDPQNGELCHSFVCSWALITGALCRAALQDPGCSHGRSTRNETFGTCGCTAREIPRCTMRDSWKAKYQCRQVNYRTFFSLTPVVGLDETSGLELIASGILWRLHALCRCAFTSISLFPCVWWSVKHGSKYTLKTTTSQSKL